MKRWPAVDATETQQPDGTWVCDMHSHTRYNTPITTVGRAKSRSNAINNARRAMRKAIASQEKRDKKIIDETGPSK